MKKNNILIGNEIINIIGDNSNLSYVIEDNSNIVINIYNELPEDTKINIIQNNNSTLIINLAHFVNKSITVDINITVEGNNNKTVVNTRSICEKEKGIYNVSIKVNEKTYKNEVNENLKGINEEGQIILNPILKIDTKEVNASHNATVGKFDEDVIFYLKSKGIEKENIVKMLKQSFIYNLFSKDFINLLNKGKDENE